MQIKLADDLKPGPREWSVFQYLLSQFPNWHLFKAFYKRISLCLLNEKYISWQTWRILYPPLNLSISVIVKQEEPFVAAVSIQLKIFIMNTYFEYRSKKFWSL